MSVERIDGIMVYNKCGHEEFVRRVWSAGGLGFKRMEFWNGIAGDTTSMFADGLDDEGWTFVDELRARRYDKERYPSGGWDLLKIRKQMEKAGSELRNIIRDAEFNLPPWGHGSTLAWVDVFGDAGEQDGGVYFESYSDVYVALIALLNEHKLLMQVEFSEAMAKRGFYQSKAMIDVDYDKLMNQVKGQI